MYGMLTIDMRGGHIDRALCTTYKSGWFLATPYPSRADAEEQAIECTKWYQRDISPLVVYTAVPLPQY